MLVKDTARYKLQVKSLKVGVEAKRRTCHEFDQHVGMKFMRPYSSSLSELSSPELLSAPGAGSSSNIISKPAFCVLPVTTM
jgi:hypothetical protein